MHALPLAKRVEKLTALLEIGKAMASERNLDRLLRLILDDVTKVMEAERSSLFLVDRERDELWSKIAQDLEVREIRVKIGTGIAGHVAQTGEVVNIQDAYADPRFSQETDRRTGYRTRTILCTPMRNKHNEVIGVLQVLNKRDGCFGGEDEDLLLALSSQAAVAIENAILYEDIERLFEGFIRASVYAIESRDPTTSGHSERVATLAVGLAQAVNHTTTGPYADVTFSEEDLREIRYAGLLHDFGKVGVREPVLVKANKLYEERLELLVSRFKFIRKAIENECLQRKLDVVLGNGQGARQELEALDAELQARLAELDEHLRFIQEANRPCTLTSDAAERLRHIAGRRYADTDGTVHPYLLAAEAEDLAIARGTLNRQERREIESHVTHTYRFLGQIPWTRDLRRVPAIAYSHHEKLDGRGYPNGLRGEAIPIQARMMAICDVYDALTASDRPYKSAMSPERAIAIVEQEADAGQLDRELVRIFVRDAVWRCTHGMGRKAAPTSDTPRT
jgi:HD-GYP domain-containing protein (c-di-GMP phosphodiesterase class II)